MSGSPPAPSAGQARRERVALGDDLVRLGEQTVGPGILGDEQAVQPLDLALELRRSSSALTSFFAWSIAVAVVAGS